jgi:hypothetical protein
VWLILQVRWASLSAQVIDQVKSGFCSAADYDKVIASKPDYAGAFPAI